LREELTQLLADDDERWYAFGFDKPSDPNTPDVPENLTATPGAASSGTLFLHCDTARRGDGYRFIITHAVTNVKLAEKLSAEPEAVISGLPTNTPVKATVSAKNATGESPASDPVTATVP
jgi:hypothetical protein